MRPVILWFRRNLRLHDNAAVAAAVESGRPVVPVYIVDELDGGGASRWWLHHSLISLDKALRQHGTGLVVRAGRPAELLPEMADATGASGIYLARRREPLALDQENSLATSLGGRCTIHSFDDSYLLSPDDVLTLAGTPFKVFTPFWRAATGLGEPRAALGKPASFETTHGGLDAGEIGSLQLLPRTPDWAAGLRDTWKPGEEGAFERLDTACEVAQSYAEHRDRPDIDGTSRLSPHLHFGEISPRQAWHDISLANVNADRGGPEALLRQLYWREFSAYLLYHFPHLPNAPLRAEFGSFPWIEDVGGLRAWQKGLTGYPIVDAGMRQLWHTGWMHNRVRMIVASFLVKDLRVSWRRGAEWFMDTLVDADLANNSASWQWVAGSGTDAAPYFRIFNPVLQSKKFDPTGYYVRRWVPELAKFPANRIHEPWKASEAEQRAAATIIGSDYPAPIVDHGRAREAALTAYEAIRKQAGSPTTNNKGG
jgi:deoxyribodipyrimidine photo-lyase